MRKKPKINLLAVAEAEVSGALALNGKKNQKMKADWQAKDRLWIFLNILRTVEKIKSQFWKVPKEELAKKKLAMLNACLDAKPGELEKIYEKYHDEITCWLLENKKSA